MAKVLVSKYITADPRMCHGKPTFRRTRVMVWQILEMLSAGETADEIIRAFPALTRNHIQAALGYAAQALTGDRAVG